MATTGVSKRDWVALEHKYYQGTFKRQPVTFVRGQGTRVWDSDGKEYLDLVAGFRKYIAVQKRKSGLRRVVRTPGTFHEDFQFG